MTQVREDVAPRSQVLASWELIQDRFPNVHCRPSMVQMSKFVRQVAAEQGHALTKPAESTQTQAVVLYGAYLAPGCVARPLSHQFK